MGELDDLERRIKFARKKLETCRKMPISAYSVGREEILKYKLERLEEQRNLCWKQRAHAHCLIMMIETLNSFTNLLLKERKEAAYVN